MSICYDFTMLYCNYMKKKKFSNGGKLNSLKPMVCKRPISVIQTIMNVKAKARLMRTCHTEDYLKPVKGENK